MTNQKINFHIQECKDYFVYECKKKKYKDTFLCRLIYFQWKQPKNNADFTKKYINKSCEIERKVKSLINDLVPLDINPLFYVFGIDFILYKYAKEYIKIYNACKNKV